MWGQEGCVNKAAQQSHFQLFLHHKYSSQTYKILILSKCDLLTFFSEMEEELDLWSFYMKLPVK